MSFEITSVGFYDYEGTYFYINPMNGFEANSTELARGAQMYVVRVISDNRRYPYGFDVEITKELAKELSDLYDEVSARARYLAEEREERERRNS